MTQALMELNKEAIAAWVYLPWGNFLNAAPLQLPTAR